MDSSPFLICHSGRSKEPEYNQFMRWKWFGPTRINAGGNFTDIRGMGNEAQP